MDPFTAMAVGSIGSAVIGGIFGSSAQSSQNRANMQLAKYQNAWNEQMYEKQKADQIEFWNMQNEYNDPKNVMARMTNAGLNPRAQNVQGWANASEMQAPKAQPAADMEYKSPLFAFTELSNIVSMLQDVKMKDAQIGEINSRKALNDAQASWTLTRDDRDDAAFELWRAMNYKPTADGYRIDPRVYGAGVEQIVAKTKELKSKSDYQQSLAQILAENQKLGIDPNGTWLDNFYKQVVRQSLRYFEKNH